MLERSSGETVIGEAVDEARLLAAAELVGVMTQALETTLEYVKQREQFGQPIGKFQALQHRLELSGRDTLTVVFDLDHRVSIRHPGRKDLVEQASPHESHLFLRR